MAKKFLGLYALGPKTSWIATFIYVPMSHINVSFGHSDITTYIIIRPICNNNERVDVLDVGTESSASIIWTNGNQYQLYVGQYEVHILTQHMEFFYDMGGVEYGICMIHNMY